MFLMGIIGIAKTKYESYYNFLDELTTITMEQLLSWEIH